MDFGTIDHLVARTDSPTPVGSISRMTDMRPLYPTRCMHTIAQEDDNSVLSLAASQKYLFSGSQSSKIHVWDQSTFSLVTTLKGHRGSVLGLTLSPDEAWLFSCSGDGAVRVWDTNTLTCSFLIQSCHDVGDVFSVVYSANLHTLYFGSQNTSIQWFDFDDPQTEDPALVTPLNPRSALQKSKFFDSMSCKDIIEEVDQFPEEHGTKKCVIREKSVRPNAHNGYVYCLLHALEIPNVQGEVIISGSGDGDVKIWAIDKSGIRLLSMLAGNMDKGVLSLALSEDSYLFCGVQGGDILIWDLETHQLIRSVMAHTDDVLSVVVRGPSLFSASADGTIKLWSEGFEFRECMDDHDGIVLSMICSKDYLITGSSDHSIKFWDIAVASRDSEQFRRNSTCVTESSSSDTLLYVLDKWIAMRTVSGALKHMEECRRGARFLKNVLQQLGAESRMIPGAAGRNPLVYGRFTARRPSNNNAKKVPTVLVYGHYDVIAAENDQQQWKTDPFRLTGKNGYLYGRGTSDNKGPVLACIFAVYELLKEGLLDVNVIFLVEGEEESGSVGFTEAVSKNKELFEDVDLILLSNSYWLGEDVPCLTYGLRGVIHASITISNTLADLHSGVEGGAVSEPLIDLIHVTGQLVDNTKKVLVPGFYDNVRPVTPEEEQLYDPIIQWLQTSETALSNTRQQHSSITSPTLSDRSRHSTASHDEINNNNNNNDDDDDDSNDRLDTEKLKKQLMARWRFPTLSIHKIDVSINNPTIIPRCAKASISMRIVPDQNISDICDKFKAYVHQVFEGIHSENDIKVEIKSAADYWLGNPSSKYFKLVEEAIEKEWNTKPLYIREGGSIPAVRFLEKFCNAPAVHFPMGQASDQAHLHNERIRLRNLHAGKRIIKNVLQNVAKPL